MKVDEDNGLGAVTRAWLPLAASWMLMSVELPSVSAVIARMAAPETHLAAYGSVVFPLALIIEAPIIMLLAASTALSKDKASYESLLRFTHRLSFLLTVLHATVAFSPLFDTWVVPAMDVPPEVIEPARLGLRIMVPWTWPIAYRRFCQGVLIRFGYSKAVSIGTLIRLVAMVSTLVTGWLVLELPGVAVGASAVIAGVLAEAAYAGWRVRPVVAEHLSHTDADDPPLRGQAFASFYIPLGMTSLITLAAQPMCAAGMGRMPEEIESLALWPVMIGLIFMLQALGLAYNEVVVAWVGRPEARPALWRFTLMLCFGTGGALGLLAATPLADFWLARLSNLPPDLVEMGKTAMWLAVPIPAMRGLNSWYQGILVHRRTTRAITESVAIYMAVAAAVLLYGIREASWPGVLVSISAYSIGRIVQSGWLWLRSREAVAELDLPVG
jgi:hypothetical protein